MKEIVSRCKRDAGMIAQIKAQARILECYGEYYREIGAKFKALSTTTAAFTLFPHKRNLRHLLHDLKTHLLLHHKYFANTQQIAFKLFVLYWPKVNTSPNFLNLMYNLIFYDRCL